MNNINLLMLILFVYEIRKIAKNNYYRISNYDKYIDSFKHRPSSKKYLISISMIATIYCLWLLFNSRTSIYDCVFLELYMLIKYYNTIRKIEVFESGIYYYGRFIYWEKIHSVKEWNETSIKINITNGWFINGVLDEIYRRYELLKLIEKHVKIKKQYNNL